jgi:hypothetical protein
MAGVLVGGFPHPVAASARLPRNPAPEGTAHEVRPVPPVMSRVFLPRSLTGSELALPST